ncbi:MAG: penicillin-binding protein 2 [Patescibacteria group bacterium]
MVPRRRKKLTLEDWRTNTIFVCFVSSFLLIIVRLFNIQVLNHERYLALAQDQYWDQTIISAKRGDILSSDGYVLAGTQTYYLMFGEPKKIKDPYQIANDLADIMTNLRYKEDTAFEISSGGGDKEAREDMKKRYFDEMYKSLSLNLMWVPLQKELTPIEKEEIEKRNIEGIGFDDMPIRYYPEGSLASHILGFVASNDKGEKTGYYGIEGSLNNDLKGRSGKLLEETDAVGLPILMGSYKKVEPVQGRDVILTINRSVQYIVEKRLKEAVEKYDAVSGSIIVMNPFTGEILAMANYPTYYPSDFTAEDESKEDQRRKSIERKNLSISDTYEPGSVIKPLTISAAIDLGIVTPTTTYQDSGPTRYSDYVIDNWDGKHYGLMNIIELLQKSNNIGAAWVGHQVGREKLYKYFSDFGIGTKTNIDLEGEDSGILRNYKEWTDIDTATAAFGQGLSATPLQVLNAFNAIANGGYLLQPKIISKLVDEKESIDIPVKIVRQVMSKETSDTMVDLLEKAAEGGEAKYFILKDYRVSGKTGTAQIPEGGKYSPDRTNATFVGFMTGSKVFSMIVKFEEPKVSIYAAETSAPVWMQVALDLVNFYGIPPDKITDSAAKN